MTVLLLAQYVWLGAAALLLEEVKLVDVVVAVVVVGKAGLELEGDEEDELEDMAVEVVVEHPAGMSQVVTPPYATTGPGVQTRLELELDDDVVVVVVDVVLRLVSNH